MNWVVRRAFNAHYIYIYIYKISYYFVMEVAGCRNVESPRIPFALNRYIYIYICME